MNLRALSSIAALAAMALAGCGDRQSTTSQVDEGAPAVQRYSAAAFFKTTSFGLAPGYAWSHDDQELLLHSDETGIFNAYALEASGGEKRALTSSTGDSTFAVSWFP
ncbi:MAG: hypothetical protein RBS02_15630, partial [Steroidobacteraceae bacterium]|nr:hypothetical protein [Steroidobacteraceae bacterium]